MKTATNCNAEIQPEKNLAAVCGLFCRSCGIYLATKEDPERLTHLAEQFGRPVEDIICHGCRADTRFFHCEENCSFVACAAEKGVDFCGECAEYPCKQLRVFQGEMPHRIELWKSQERIREAGYQTWYQEMTEHYNCPECHTMNSAYAIACRSCGATPSCAYVRLHREQIEAFMNNAQR